MTRRRWALRALAGVLLVLFVLAAMVAVAVLRGVTIDVSRWRDAAAMRLATVLERPASLHGP
ncbi:MAG: hypothetical protein JNK68_02360, partial [Betaproteobacteria bacterium]|nr:hypothetical protein [Betaproteobacteria bacterium]